MGEYNSNGFTKVWHGGGNRINLAQNRHLVYPVVNTVTNIRGEFLDVLAKQELPVETSRG